MADYQFHSSDCPLWHPEKFAAAGSSSSRCWCQRWSNLVEWNVAAEGSSDGMVLPEVKKEALPAKIAPKPRQNPAPILQTDAFLGSNLWPAEELKFEQDASVDLDLLWKKLDGAAENSQLAAAGARKASSSRDSAGSASPPFLSRMDTMSRSADGFGLSLPSGSPMSMSSVGSCLDALSLNMATDNSGLDHLTRSPLDMDPSSLFDDPLLPAATVLPSPLIPQTVSVPCISPGMAGSVSSVEVDPKPTPKRRGRPPGKANARKGSESTESGREPKRSRKRSPSFSDSMDSDYFDTTGYVISPDDLKPVPVIRKSKKKLTPEEAKDEKYWARRRKNNLAAKRSRDIRRLKENQIALRAAFLESENLRLKTELDDMRTDNEALRLRLEAYEGVKH